DGSRAALARKIMGAVRAELPYSSECIVVAVENGRIRLKGEVEWSYQMQRAVQVVTSFRGVACVANEIKLRPRASTEDVRRRIEDVLQHLTAARAGPRGRRGLQTGTAQEHGGRQGMEGAREGEDRGRLRSWVVHEQRGHERKDR